MDVKLTIYKVGSNGMVRYVAEKWDFSDTYMGERYVSFNAMSNEPIDWHIGDYLDYRGARYFLNSIPSCTQSARTDESGDAYSYDNVKFDGTQGSLQNCMILDVTPTTGDYIAAKGTNYTGSSVFTIFCAETTVQMKDSGGEWHDVTLSPVAYLAGLVQANLNRLYPFEPWRVDVNPGLHDLEDKVVSLNKWYATQALAEIHNLWDVDYIIIGYTIKIGYTLNNVTGNDNEAFLFGYGEGYAQRDDDGKSLFKIKRTANSSQRIITRLRAQGSTRNMPYRYYNKKYELPQTMFVNNLQLPDTFEIPSVKQEHNASRDETYGVDADGRPNVRHVLGDTNDAYVDKRDNAALCLEGIREGAAFWDGSDSELEEIYPTIQSGTYRDLRAALIPDIDGKIGGDGETSTSAYYPYGNDERIDEILGVDEQTTNIGDGIVAEADVTSQQEQTFNVSVSETSQTGSTRDFYGTSRTLFTTKEVNAGKYMMSASENHVIFHMRISSQNVYTFTGGFLLKIYQVPVDGSAESLVAVYRKSTSISSGTFSSIRMPDLPDVRQEDKVSGRSQVENITITKKSNVRVEVQPYFTYNSTSTGSHTLTYYITSNANDVVPTYVWAPIDATDTFANQPFYIYIKDIGIDMKSLQTTGEDATIHFNTGQCGGMDFKFNPNSVENITVLGKKGWKLTITERFIDNNIHVYYPNSNSKILAGDRYVLLNIEFPDIYIKIAENRLLVAATEYLADNSEAKFVYEPEISNIYLQNNIDRCAAAGTPQKSVYWNLYAGYKFSMRGIPSSRDEILPVIDNVTIKSVTIKEGYSEIPQAEIVLNNENEQSTIQKLTVSVDRIYNSLWGNGGNGGGQSAASSYATLISLLNSEGGKRFLSKTKNDSAQGLIEFLAGLQTGVFQHGYQGASIDANGNAELESATIRRGMQSYDFTKGQLGGSGWGIYNNLTGKSTLEIDNLIVRMKAIFAELEIRKLSYLGGDYIFSAAGSKIIKVQYIGHDEQDNEVILNQTELLPLVDSNGNFIMQDNQVIVWEKDIDVDEDDIDAFRCYMYSDDGTTATMNWWQVNDLARCQTFNVKEDRTLPSEWETDLNDNPIAEDKSVNAGNRYYWRQVVGVGSAVLEDGKTYNYVDLSVTQCSSNAQGAQEGLVDDWPEPNDAIVQLGNTIDPNRQNVIEVLVEGSEAPAIIEYAGVNNFNLASHRRTKLSPKGDEFIAKSFKIMTSNGDVLIPVDRGEWNSTFTYYNYDRVSWNGTLWLCVIPDNYDAQGNRIGIVNSEPSSSNTNWLAQVTGGAQGPAGQSAPTMTCIPNPLMVDTDKNKLATSAWSANVSVYAYYGGVRQSISSFVSVTSSGTWTIGTPTIDSSGIGTIPISGSKGSAVLSEAVNVVVAIQDPVNTGNSINVNGNFTVSPTMRGGDGVPQVVMNPEVVWLPTDANSYLAYDYSAQVVINIANASGDFAQVPLSVLFDGNAAYSIMDGQTEVVSVTLDDIDDEDIILDVSWARSYAARSLDIPLAISYKMEQGGETQVVHAVLSIRANKQGPNGENSLSLQYIPSAPSFSVDTDDLAVSSTTLSVEVRAYNGTQRIASVDGISNLSCNDQNVASELSSEIKTETISGQTYQYAVINIDIWEGYTYDIENIFVTFDLLDGDNGYTIKGGFPILKSKVGSTGRGISSIVVEYGVSASATDIPSSWGEQMPPIGQREFLWTRTTITYTDGTTKVFHTITYQGGDGANGTSVSIQGSAVGHTEYKSDLDGSSASGLWLVDENGATPTSVAATVDTSTTPWTENTNITAGDGYIVESTGHLWVYTSAHWIDAGRIKGDDGLPSYIHYAWANSSDGSEDFTVTKEVGEEFKYMGVCANNTQEDPGSDYDPDSSPSSYHPWEAYEWNNVKGNDGDHGTLIKGEAIGYVNTENASEYDIQQEGYHLADLPNHTIDENDDIVSTTAGQGIGHKLICYSAQSGVSIFDTEEGDAYTIEGVLYSSVDLHWVNLGKYNGDSAYIHYAWADNVIFNSAGQPIQVEGFTVDKFATEDKDFIGLKFDNNIEDPDYATDYAWTRIKGNGVVSTQILYAQSAQGVNPPDDGWVSNLDSILPIEPLHYLWTKTIMTFSNGESSVAYSVAYSGKEGADGSSVVILGIWPAGYALPTPIHQGDDDYIPLQPNGDPTHLLRISEGFIIEDTRHLWMWMGNDVGWQDTGKFNGTDGRTSYLHIAWANSIKYGSDGKITEIKDFTVSKPEGKDFYYMGVCTDFEQLDPGYDYNPNTSPDTYRPWDSYTWNYVKGAEGSNGTKVLEQIVAKAAILSAAYTENGLYAVDNPSRWPTASGQKVIDPTPCIRRRVGNIWPNTVLDRWADRESSVYSGWGVYYPQEGESFVSSNGILWSYVEAKWVNLGKYDGSSAYLHLAWANVIKYNAQGVIIECEDFTTSKTTTEDYIYVGFCSNDQEEDPDYGDGGEHSTEPWKYYTWQRLRGLSQAIIDLGTDQAVADADNLGRITGIDKVNGLPSTIRLIVDNENVPVSTWDVADVTLVYSGGTSKTLHLKGSFTDSSVGVYLKSATYTSGSDAISLSWDYRQQNNADQPLTLRQIKFKATAYHSDLEYTASKSIPFIVNRMGEGSDFAVQYSATNNGPWHDTYQITDKWMRIYTNGGWGNPIKIAATDMNVRGEAFYHNPTIPSSRPVDTGLLCLIDTVGNITAAEVTYTSGNNYNAVAATLGDCYILRDENSDANGHLFIATDTGWQDLGQIAGANGVNAVVAALNPSSIILNQKDDNTLDNFSTTVVVVDGSTLVDDFTIGTLDIGNHPEWHLASAYVVSGTKTIMMQAGTHSVTVTNDDNENVTQNVYWDSGYIDVPVTYNGSDWLLRFNWYANLLGTWKQTIIGDVNKSIADKVTYYYGEDGEVYFRDENGTFLFSASRWQNLLESEEQNIHKISNIEGTVDGITAQVQVLEDGIEQANSRIDQRANEILSTVNNLSVDAENMFAFARPVAFSLGAVPYIQGYGIEGTGNTNRVSHLGFKGVKGRYVLTCEMRMQQTSTSVKVNVCDVNPIRGMGSAPTGTDVIFLGIEWEKKTFFFDVQNNYVNEDSYDGFVDFEGVVSGAINTDNRIYVRNLMIARGECKPTGFNISSKDMETNLPDDILTFTANTGVTIQSEKYYGYPIYKITSFPMTGYLDALYSINAPTVSGRCYTLSFFAKSVSDCLIACFMHGEQSTIDGSIAPTNIEIASLQRGEMTNGNWVDGETYIRPTTAWKRYIVHWYNNGGRRNIILGRVDESWQSAADPQVYITGVEFREGYWTADKLNSQSMIRQTATEIEMKVNDTGINIEDGTITLNADTTTIIGDLSLKDTNQGLVLYDGGNVERVTVKPETLGDLEDYDFGMRGVSEKDAIAINGTVTFDTIELGEVVTGSVFNVNRIRVTRNIGSASQTVRFSYILKRNGVQVLTNSGTAMQGTVGNEGYDIEGCTWTADASGEMTLDLQLTNITGAVSFHLLVQASISGVGLNKIGKDGAVFAESQTHYNWFGADKTEMRNGYSKFEVSDDKVGLSCGAKHLEVTNNGVFGGDVSNNTPYLYDIGSRVNVKTITSSYTASLLDGLIYVKGDYNVTLPLSSTCVGKVFYMKSTSSATTVLTSSNSDVIISAGSSSSATSAQIGRGASMFISTGENWLHFYCV